MGKKLVPRTCMDGDGDGDEAEDGEENILTGILVARDSPLDIPAGNPRLEWWLKNIDDNAEAVMEIMVSHSAGSVEAAAKQFNYWRGLNLLGIELFGYGNGEEWMTSQVLFKKK
ncbi:hypothetical protein Scep_024853 [Stephania cephalantha]|uniref:Uncharacterized protein n=1 Tax=Stephania cephalantha TaxID=152367 RepID=A0AAP0F4L2_9MAGN